MTVTLTPELEQFVAEQIKSGHYGSANDVVAQSLGMLRAQEEFIRAHELQLREKIGAGLEEIRRGDVVDGKAAIEELRQTLRKRDPGAE